ncbi:MAG TPA: TonB-dependent receptor [Phnomibacter sp.]|nr:TonB-dependent receptor [Phnomibacter sp.]
MQVLTANPYKGKVAEGLVRIIKGTVKDAQGNPLAGATVKVTGAKAGVPSNEEGMFFIEIADTVSSIEISYVGFKTINKSIANETEIEIVLTPVNKDLDAAVVVAFGQQRKISVVGSQSVVNPEELKIPVRDLTNALAGRLPGLVAFQRSGEPGYDAASIFIRGISTFGSSPRGPLLVVDGVPDRPINNIDPEDIESFTILKDASATAVFGTRGANGVILINTKKGKAGKTQVNVEVNQALTKFTHLPSFVDAPAFMRLYNEGLSMRGRTPQYTEDVIQKHIDGVDPDLYPNVNWFKELFNDFGSNTRVNLNVRGGAANANYYISTGFYEEMGMFKRDNIQSYNSAIKFNRYNFTSNVNVNLTPTTKVELGINGFITNGNYPGIGTAALFSEATRVPPHIIPARYSNGLWPQYQLGTPASPYRALTQSGYVTEFSTTIRSNIRVRQELGFLLKGLSATSMFAFDSYSNNTLSRTRNVSTFSATGRNANGDLITTPVFVGSDVLGYSNSAGGNRRFYTETAINYNNTFNNDHYVSAMLLYNQSDYVNGSAGDLVGSIPFRVRGLTGRATYGYQNKYFVEGNFGYNGSENFAPGSRFGFFPSVGLGWVVSGEKFFEPLRDVITHFKLRYSYGLSGNSNTGARFLFLTQINSGNGYTYGSPGSQQTFGGLQEGQVGSNVTWETSFRHNLGIEVNTLKNNLKLIVELFQERREGILLRNFTIPYASGYRVDNIPYGNIGITENKGIDVSLTYNKSFRKDAFVAFTGNFNYNINKNIFDGLPPWQYPWLDRQGHPIDQRFGYVALGLFADSAEILAAPKQAGDVRPGDIKFKDLNGDGIINAYDQTAIGYGAVPRIVYGLNFAFGFKNFDVSLFFQGAGLVDFNYASGFGTTPFVEGATYGNMYSTINSRWTPDFKSGDPLPFYPRLSTNQTITTNYQLSTWWIKRADYIRLKNAEVGYTFKVNKLRKYSVSKMRAFINGTNLFTKSRWNVWDPELGDGRGTSYPNISVYNAGFRVSFN